MSSNNSNYTQEVTIPSLGYLNPEIPEGKVIQRCMMVTDQKFLAGSNLSGNALTRKLLERTVESPEGFDASKLTAADTIYLLFKLRILSYGEKYKFKARCPECGKRFEVNVDLSELTVDTLESDYASNLKVTLPRSGDTVYTKLLTNEDLDAVNAEVERRVKKFGVTAGDIGFVLRLAAMVTKIELKKPNAEGDKVLEHPIDIQNYIEKLTDLDATAIRATTDNIAYGIYPILEERCPHCGEYVDISLDLGAGFFRPKYDLQSEGSN